MFNFFSRCCLGCPEALSPKAIQVREVSAKLRVGRIRENARIHTSRADSSLLTEEHTSVFVHAQSRNASAGAFCTEVSLHVAVNACTCASLLRIPSPSGVTIAFSKSRTLTKYSQVRMCSACGSSCLMVLKTLRFTLSYWRSRASLLTSQRRRSAGPQVCRIGGRWFWSVCAGCSCLIRQICPYYEAM
jgi:hypothetical protein